MSIERNRFAALLAAAVIFVGQFVGQIAAAGDFAERYAAWQNPAPVPRVPGGGGYSSPLIVRGAPAPSPGAPGMATPMMTEESPASESPGQAPGGQQILGDVYNAPRHTPDYNRPWAPTCASCSHAPTYEAPSDPFHTCNYTGGGGGCGPLGCGPLGCGPGGFCHGGCDNGACNLFTGPPGCGGGCGNGACGGRGACDACGQFDGSCGWGPYCSNSIVWAKFDVLLWWRQGRDFPPLVTTDPANEARATVGILPDATILVGGQRTGTNMQAGGRFDIGVWASPAQTVGVGWRFFGLGKDDQSFNLNSATTPVLAVPFFNVATGVNDVLLVAQPGVRSGEIHGAAQSTFLGNDVYTRLLLARNEDSRLDFLTGWNYSRLADESLLRANTTIINDPISGLPANTAVATRDQFIAHNDFNGAIFGLNYQHNYGPWTTNWLARISMGGVHETVFISGAGSITQPGQPATATNGIFTGPANIGRFSRNEFTAVTEAGFNLAYRFAPCTQLVAGYTFIYWNDVLTAPRSIDTSTSPPANLTRPQFTFRHSDFWVQGINLGVTREF